MEEVTSTPRIHTQPRTEASQNQGSFRTHFNFPGRAVSGHDDHGYGPLATVVESFMDPGTLISMHQHRNEEIISWVPEGVMRHDDPQGNDVVTDSDHLLVMNAGSGFWHAEKTLDSDPPLRMLQIFVRPHSLDLDPGIQFESLPERTNNHWRQLFGPKDGDAPLFVRNQASCHDCWLDSGETVQLPTQEGWDTYLYVFDGSVSFEGTAVELGYTESAIVESEAKTQNGKDTVSVTALEESVLVAFTVDPDAPITRQGTIGR